MDDYEVRERFKLINEQLKQTSNIYVQGEQARIKSESIEVLIKVLSAAFDKMSAYTSLIVIGGYAAFFSIWSAVEKFVSPEVRLWTFDLMGISILIFVLSETYRITKYSAEMLNWLRVLKETPPAQFQAQQQQLTNKQDQKNVERAKTQRITQLVVTGFAIAAALILFYGIGDTLWKRAQKQDQNRTSQVLY
jgi:hypothetical protein